MSAHTPGPWTVEDVMGDGPTDVCAAEIPGQGSPNLIAFAFCDQSSGSGLPMETAIANARLIAAAPDLLASLKEWFDGAGVFPDHLSTEAALKRARAAIAKAEGRR